MSIGKSHAKVLVEKATGVTFADVAGVDEMRIRIKKHRSSKVLTVATWSTLFVTITANKLFHRLLPAAKLSEVRADRVRSR